MKKANVSYSDYLNNVPDEVSFGIENDKRLNFAYDNVDMKNPKLNIGISDEITENMELNGDMDYEGVNALIKTLTVFRNRMKIDIASAE